MIKRFFIILSLIFWCAFLGFAQVGQTGTIKGTVTSEDGDLLPGISVTLRSEALVLEKMTTVSNEKGNFRFLNLAPGKYSLTFEMEGMATMVREGVMVNANLTTTINMKMKLETLQEMIVVKGKIPTIDRHSVSNVSTMDLEFIKSIPTARDLEGYLIMVPGVTGDQYSTSSLGGTVRDNVFSLDGVNFADPVVGTNQMEYSMDIMEEVSVQTGGVSAEQSGGRGAIVNIITKSGGNRFSGSLNVYYDHESLQSDNTKDTPLEGSSSGAKFKFEPGLTLGGPIIKDKLWFFGNLSMYNSETFVPGYPAWGDSEVPQDYKRLLPYIKLTLHPSQKDKFILSYNFTKVEQNHRGASRYVTEEATWIEDTRQHIISAHWTHNFSNNLFTNLKVGYYKNNFDLIAKNDNGYGYDQNTYVSFGSYGWDDLNPRQRFQSNFDATLFVDDFLGTHEIKFGGQFVFGRGQRIVDPKYDVMDSIGMPRTWTYWTGNYAEWGLFYIGFDRKDDMKNMGFFINDTWNISRNLTLTLGGRVDIQKGIVPKQGEGQYLGQANLAHVGLPEISWDFNVPEPVTLYTWTTFSPRLGLIFDVTGDGKTLIKGTFSRYYQENLTVWFYDLNSIDWAGYDAHLNPDGSVDYVYNTYIPGTGQSGYGNHDLKAPYTDEITVGIDRELWEDWSIGLRYIRRWDKNLLETVDANSLDIDKLLDNGEFDWTNWAAVTATDPFDGSTVTFYDQMQYLPDAKYIVNPPGAERNYNGIEVQVKKRFSAGWMLQMSYTYAKSEGLIGNTYWSAEGRTGFYNNPNDHINAYGHMPLERRHQFRMSGLLKGPLGINLSGYFRFLSGYPYTRQVRSQDLGLSLFQGNETIYVEPRGSRLLPDQAILDLRVEKEFRIKNFSLKIFGDLFNVFNNNKATEVEGVSSNPFTTFEEMTNIMSPRIFRIGAKFEFN